MDLKLQPKPIIDIEPANKGIVSKEKFFVKKVIEKIKQHFFPAHLVREWRPKAELLYISPPDESIVQYECNFNRNIQNCFNEDFAEEIYLRSPPPCFVVLGKFDAKVNRLSREIAEEYGSVLIEVSNVVSEIVNQKNQTGSFLDKVLRLGVPITLNFVLAMLSYLAHTAEARHRGYVLCGLPCLNLENDLSVEQQLTYLLYWENKPTVFIYMSFEDEDLIHSRSRTRYEVKSVENFEKSILLPHFQCDFDENKAKESKDVGDDNDDDDDDDDDNRSEDDFLPEPDLNVSPSRPWVQLPWDRESQVWFELESYDKTIKPALHLLASRIDPQYFITVDSRVDNGFEIVKSRLRLLPIWKSPVPFSFLSQKPQNHSENMDEDENLGEAINEATEGVENDVDLSKIKKAIQEPPETAFSTLFCAKTLSPKFRWELSHYNYVCPVSLRAGEVTEGKSEFAVAFMKYIYFLRDKDSMELFIKNPRPFVLPVKPKFPTRFFIIGYPYCGKTTLARSLAKEFSVPLLDLQQILKNDLEEKKNCYINFCRQKAENREIIRLTTQSWKDWRLEEEQRVSLIEDWIGYIQSLLEQRIQQFYSGKKENVIKSEKEDKTKPPLNEEISDNFERKSSDTQEDTVLEVRGISVIRGAFNQIIDEVTLPDSYSTPSNKIIQALKHEDYDFDKKGFEVEANLFFSALWNSFSNENMSHHSIKLDKEKAKKENEEDLSNRSIAGEEIESVTSVNWCALLPPQSLSSLLLKKKPYTTRKQHKSFQILLEAASKAYWDESSLKSEFAKWRLPCYMDIPLCEIFIENPILIYKYCPEWMKHRPLIPDPVDFDHPAVVQAGRKAHDRARAVTLHHTTEEIGILLKNEIERAERNGMRVTGEVVSPGGWVVDNMTFEPEVWCSLTKYDVRASHIYILTDSQPEWKRIINTWFNLYNRKSLINTTANMTATPTDISEKEDEDYDGKQLGTENERELENVDSETSNIDENINIIDLVIESCFEILRGEEQIDEIYENLMSDLDESNFIDFQPISIDPFCYNLLQSRFKRSSDALDDSLLDESTLATVNFSGSSRILFSTRQASQYGEDIILGARLEVFTAKVLQMLEDKHSINQDTFEKENSYKDGVKFFFLLLTISQKLEEIKKWQASLNRGTKIREIDIFEKTESEIFSDILQELYLPFGKKPRELEPFEAEEIKIAIDKEEEMKEKLQQMEEWEGEDKKSKVNVKEVETYEDPRIYGESGPFCIVSLERNILLEGNPEIMVRYYGKLYSFWNHQCKSKFIKDPEKYAPYYSPIRCLPPLRIFVLGPFGTKKSFLASAISDKCSIHFIDYLKFLSNQLIPYVSPRPSNFTALNVPLQISDSHSQEAKAALAEFKNAPYKKRQFWLENPPLHVESWDQNEVLSGLLNFQETEAPKENQTFVYQTINFEENDAIESVEVVSKEKENFTSMKDIETLIDNYINKNTELTKYCIDKSLNLLWNTAPYITEGFVIQDFPFRWHDSKLIKEKSWLPDLVVEMLATEDEIIDENIDRLMESWDTQLKQQMVEEQLLEDTVKAVQDSRIMLRRIQLIAEMRGTRPSSYDNLGQTWSKANTLKRNQDEKLHFSKTHQGEMKNSSSISEQAIDDASFAKVTKSTDFPSDNEIEELLRKEFPPLNFNPIFESYEEGKARIVDDITRIYRKDVEEINKIKGELQKFEIPWLSISNVEETNTLFIWLDSLKKRMNQRGEFAFELSMEMAEKLLEQGFYFLSKFARFCPVQAYRQKNPVNMFMPLLSRNKVYPVAYRTYIYFVCGLNEKIKFIKDPLKYTLNESHRPEIPLRISVIGPPKSGKSSLSKRLGLMFGLRVITMGTAIRFVLEKMKGSQLERSVNAYLKRGCFLPLSLKMEALVASLNDPACFTQGYVLDGIPFDAAVTQSLAEKKKLPFLIINLTCDSNFGKQNRQNLDLNTFRLPYKQRVNLDSKYKDWEETYRRFTQWNQSTYHNLHEVNAKANWADVFYRTYDLLKESYFEILHYVENCVNNKVLPLRYLCVNQQEYDSRKSPLENNCPVCWTETNRLRNLKGCELNLGLVQYLDYFYCVCSEHMNLFMKNPKRYLPPKGRNWPTSLPLIVQRKTFDVVCSKCKIHGHGRCPVTRIDFPNSLNWEGDRNFAVYYENKVFLCKNAEMMERFLARPWRYSNADTVFEGKTGSKSHAIEKLGPPKVTSLPPIGFLEQTVSELILQSLQVLGSVRPVYPHLTPSCTACIFLALYLKVYNKKRISSVLEKEYLNFMFYYCKAYKFRVPYYVPRSHDEEIQDELKSERSDSSDSIIRDYTIKLNDSKSSEGTLHSRDDLSFIEDITWMDFESQADKQLWSAKLKNPKYEEMILIHGDELQEIPDIPKRQVVLRYSKIRGNPLPPVPNCLTLIYCRKSNLKLPDKFNVYSLYQPAPPFESPYPQSVSFNPERQFSLTLFKTTQSQIADSDSCLLHEKETNANTDDEGDNAIDFLRKLRTQRFVPRFHILDVLPPMDYSMPSVIESLPIIFEPHRDYTYTLLLAHFFQVSHVLKCYEWQESKAHMDYSSLFDKYLGLSSVRSEFFGKPKTSPSMKTMRPIESYQQIFSARNTFFYDNAISEGSHSDEKEVDGIEEEDEVSCYNFMQLIILDQLEDMFLKLSLSDFSYDSYETNILSLNSDPAVKPAILIREVLPYPPLIWDIISRPYYSQASLPILFNSPLLESIAHERHVSLLDGIIEPNDNFRFVRYPTWVDFPLGERFSQTNVSDESRQYFNSPNRYGHFHQKEIYFVYDYFNLDWTAFLCCPFSLAYNNDVTTNFSSYPDGLQSTVDS